MLWKTISMRRGCPVRRPTVVMSMTPPGVSASRSLPSGSPLFLGCCTIHTTSAGARSIHGLYEAVPRRLLAAAPVAGDLEAVFAGGGVGEGRVHRSRLLASIQDERDLIAAEALPDLARVKTVNLDRRARALISSRTSEVVDLEHDAPNLPARVHRPIEDVSPRLSVVRAPAGALALLVADVGHDPGHAPADLTREAEVLSPAPLRHDRRR